MDMLKQEVVATWEHIDFSHIDALLARTAAGGDVMVVRNGETFLISFLLTIELSRDGITILIIEIISKREKETNELEC